jgi:glycosyltransferase involved in cell wall biosynthesis
MGVELPPLRPEPDPERAELRRRHQLHTFSVLALGRLVPIKGLDLAIRALAGRRFQLLIAGAGPERGRLEALARERGADVRFLGQVVGSHKQQLLRAADAFVLPSRRLSDGRSEGLPNALLEALAHGLPVVAARSDGVEELLAGTPLARFLVPPDDPLALARALENLRDAPAARRELAQHARSIAARFGWTHVAERAHALIAGEAEPVGSSKNAPIQGQSP